MDKNEVLDEINRQVSACEKCPLHFSRKKAVPGEGPADAQILFIGEGPGFFENEQGRPFVGQAGKLLDNLLLSVGLSEAPSLLMLWPFKCSALIGARSGRFGSVSHLSTEDIIRDHGEFRFCTVSLCLIELNPRTLPYLIASYLISVVLDQVLTICTVLLC